MTAEQIKIGTKVRDCETDQTGTIEAQYRSANPNVESDLIAVRLIGNAIIWTSAVNLEQV